MAAYFDESDDSKQAYGVGGFLGNQHDCVHLEWTWRRDVLDKYDLKYFKASELEYGLGEFRKLRDNPNSPNAPFSAREKTLFREIKTKTVDLFLSAEFLIGFGAVVVLPDYYRLVKELDAAGFAIPAPYWFAAQVVYLEAGWIMNDWNKNELPSQKAHVRPIYDSHTEYSRKAKEIFNDYRDKNPRWSRWLLSPHYESDQDYILLQVADNLVYEMRKLVIKDAFNEVRPERIAMQRLKERVWKVYMLNYEAMKTIMQRPTNVVGIKPEISNPWI